MNQNPMRSPSYTTVNRIVLYAIVQGAKGRVVCGLRSADKRADNRDGGRGIDARVRKGGGKGAERTYSLLRTRARGAASPTPMTKLMILDTRVSNPAMMKSPPKSVEPT